VSEFTDTDTGRNVMHTKTEKAGTKNFPEYDTKVKVNPSKIQNRAWLKEVKDLKKLAPVPSPTEMKQLVGGSLKNDNSGGLSPKSDSEDPALSLPCFGLEYRRLPACPACPVRRRCKVVYRERRLQIVKKRGFEKI